ncbi:MAG: hypothetical protein LPK00_02225 [Bacillaceae bacterium]|nr:hypothetical protein [Bacillaceae bacterium]
MGRTKKGNANAQRNNNAKQKGTMDTEFASYAEMEAAKMTNSKNNKK